MTKGNFPERNKLFQTNTAEMRCEAVCQRAIIQAIVQLYRLIYM